MVEKLFNEVYDKFKLSFYRRMFQGLEQGETALTAIETFCVEVIAALNRPTIKEVTEFLDISQPNTAYKVSSLARKGYIKKVRSTEDKREYFLELTDKYDKYDDLKKLYVHIVMNRVKERFPQEDIDTLARILEVMSTELMPEVTELIEGLKNKREKKSV